MSSTPALAPAVSLEKTPRFDSSSSSTHTSASSIPSHTPSPTSASTSTSSPIPSTSQPSSNYNTRNLGLRLAADAAASFTAACLVAPAVSIIDRAIMENASGANSLVNSLKTSFAQLLRSPAQVVTGRPFALILMLYGGTYFSANAVDTASSTISRQKASTVTAGAAKFTASSAANIGICIYKDQVYVRMYGPPGVLPRAVPMLSYTLFALRDCMTIFSSFIIPPRLGPALTPVLDGFNLHISGQTAAQFAAPALTQFVSTPVHLLGLDLYNREAASWRDRVASIRKNWAVSSFARIGRIVPAYGVGGVVNSKIRKSLMGRLE
ncbi:sequence orphan [Ophiostoma piceae UAMH 11346]|uniref:Sequence orphan n=1 Tax=Ophiostoma piceae (strain UAMH 11346) TaxID=1262450 RepID=S3CSG6_OPHP1|nr:sequence orphan [Ophiostoma piceae UAMH 11346]